MVRGNAKLAAVSESATLAMAAKARQLKEQGVDVVSLTLGEPDFNTPEHIKEAAIQAVRDNYSHYPPLNGYPEVRAGVAQYFQQQHGLPYQAGQVIISNGAKQCLYHAFTALLNPGDEVIIPAPYWVSYRPMAEMAEAVPVFIQAGTEQQYKITPQQLEAAITPRTRLFLFNSPSNPSGMVYTEAETRALAEVLLRHPQVCIISDEIYSLISYGKTPFSIARVEGLFDRTCTINGVSKAFAMTGYRVGFLAGPDWMIQAMSKLQGQITSAVSGVAQMAALAAVTQPLDETYRMRDAYRQRRDHGLQLLAQIPELIVPVPEGAFYFYMDVSAFLHKKTPGGQHIGDTDQLALYLLNDGRVGCVSGIDFGTDRHIRLSYATDLATIEEGIARIRRALYALS
ncbi:MAG: pyridoxal phosphate-dependent aminotransferase [Bacteroidetes bacterium]|nr:pyridoxal phosphate-dependent aminotransferase [Bacteroidota bacterium]